jgi:hypothetical protein
MKVLIGCEESQTVCKAFRDKGHEAYSCDLQPCSMFGYPEWHIQKNVLEVINSRKWDLIIGHPPCTFLSNAGAVHLYPKGVLNTERYNKGIDAKALFMSILNADCDMICVENPIPSTIYGLPKYDQIIQPYEYGHPYKKATCLWLKGLPKLKPTNILQERQSTKVAGNWYNIGGKERQKNRSKTFEGIAKAMADQWG